MAGGRRNSSDSSSALINGDDQWDSSKLMTSKSPQSNSANQNPAASNSWLKPKGFSENNTDASEDDVDSKQLISLTDNSSRLQATPSSKGVSATSKSSRLQATPSPKGLSVKGMSKDPVNQSKSPERRTTSPRYVGTPMDASDTMRREDAEEINGLLRALDVDPAMFVGQDPYSRTADTSLGRHHGGRNLNVNGRDTSVTPSVNLAESPTEMSTFLSSSYV